MWARHLNFQSCSDRGETALLSTDTLCFGNCLCRDRYNFNLCESGRYSGWTKSSKGYRYYYKGRMLVGRYQIKGKTYDFDKNGHAVLKPA